MKMLLLFTCFFTYSFYKKYLFGFYCRFPFKTAVFLSVHTFFAFLGSLKSSLISWGYRPTLFFTFFPMKYIRFFAKMTKSMGAHLMCLKTPFFLLFSKSIGESLFYLSQNASWKYNFLKYVKNSKICKFVYFVYFPDLLFNKLRICIFFLYVYKICKLLIFKVFWCF
jgi:hypothetical protein